MANRPSALILRHLRKIVADPEVGHQSDRQLLQQFLSKQDEAAFAALVRRHGSMVLAVCQSTLHHEQDAQDASQATFLVLARKAASIRKQESVGSWLHGVAYRLALKARRGSRRIGETERRRGRRIADSPIRRVAGSPADDLTWRELREVLHQELNRLPEKNRLPLILCYLEGQTQEEAARQLGWTAATVKGRLDRGRHLLRKRLTRRGLTLSVPLLAAALSRDVAMASSPLWLKATAQVAVLFARRESAATLSSQAAAWAQGALKTIVPAQLKIGATLVLAFSVLAAGTGLALYQAPTAKEPQATQEKSKPEAKTPQENRQETPAPARLDQFGDPLPQGAVARLGTVRFRHAWFINSVAFTEDGKEIISHGFFDGVRIWDAATGREIRNLLAKRDGWIGSGILSPDGKSLITLERRENKHFVRIRNRADLKLVREFEVGSLQPMQLSPDGKILAGRSGNIDTFELWDLAAGRQLRSWKAHEGNIWCYTFSADGKTLVTGGQDKAIRLWEVATGKKRQEILTPNNVGQVAISADGTLLASLGMTEVKFGQGSVFFTENQIRIWDVGTGKALRQLTMPVKEGLFGHPQGFSTLNFSPDGNTLVSAGEDGWLRFWNPSTGKELRQLSLGSMRACYLAFFPDGKRLAVAAVAIRVIDVDSGKEVLQLAGHQAGVEAAAITPDGRTIITAGYDQDILLWDATTGQQRRRLEGDLNPRLAFRPAGAGGSLFSGGTEKTIRIWDVASSKERGRIERPPGSSRLLDVSRDAKILAFDGVDNDNFPEAKKTIFLVDVRTGKELTRLKEHGERISGAAFGPDGRTLTVWCGDHTVHIWDLVGRRKIRQFPFAQALPPAPFEAAPSPDGRLIAYGSQDRYLVLHELATGQEIRRIDNLADGVSALAFSLDNRTLAWGGGMADPAIHLIEVATGRERHRLAGHKGRINSLTFSADGQTLISASDDTTALVWDLTGQHGAQGRHLAPEDLDACWSDLAGDDAIRAFQAIRRLATSPAEAIPYLRDHLKAVPPVDEKRLARLIVDLDSNQFAARESATKKLEKLGELAAPACRKALEQGPSAEARRRLEALIEKQNRDWQNPSPDQLRSLRAIELLEHIGTPGARLMLETLAKGAPEARPTQEAKASLERLAKRPPTAP